MNVDVRLRENVMRLIQTAVETTGNKAIAVSLGTAFLAALPVIGEVLQHLSALIACVSGIIGAGYVGWKWYREWKASRSKD